MNHASEHEEQTCVVDYVRAKYPGQWPYLFAVPNAGKRSFVVGRRFKREGLSPGYPDLGLDLPRGPYHGLRIEMKRVRGSKISPEQVAWIVRLNQVGYCAKICYGAAEAMVVIDQYLAGRL